MTSFDIFCSADESNRWYFALMFFSVCFFIGFLFCFYFLYRFRQLNPSLPCFDLTPRIVLCSAFFIKFALLWIQSSSYKGQDLHSFSTFVVTFGGYVVNAAYLMILYSWFSIFCSYFGGSTGRFFAISKKIIVFVLIFSFLQYFINFFISLSHLPFIARANVFRVYFSMFWDLLVELMFAGTAFVLWKKLEVKCACGNGGPEQIIYTLCAILAVALLVRLISLLLFMIWYIYTSNPIPHREYCDQKQLINYILKESFGQYLPLLLVIISDICHQGDKDDYLPVAEQSFT